MGRSASFCVTGFPGDLLLHHFLGGPEWYVCCLKKTTSSHRSIYHKAVQVCISLVINQFSEAPACLGPRISHGALLDLLVGPMVTCRK